MSSSNIITKQAFFCPYAYWVRVLFRVQVTESLAGKLLFAARLLPGSPFPLISFSVVAHCSTFGQLQCCCDLYGSKMDQQQHRSSNISAAKKPAVTHEVAEPAPIAAAEASCRDPN